MVNHQVQQVLLRNECHDYSIDNLMEEQMRNQTVGILGTSLIGYIVAKILNRFRSKEMACDITPDKSLTGLVQSVDLKTLLAASDSLTLHFPF